MHSKYTGFRRRRLGTLGVTTAVLAASVAGGCHLDLDARLMEEASITGGQGNPGTANNGGEPGGEGGTITIAGDGGNGGEPTNTGGGEPTDSCDRDEDCVELAGGCIEGKCEDDTCVYVECPATLPCHSRTCGATNTCSDEQTEYGFASHSLDLAADVGCDGDAQRCSAAAGDYVFVGTPDGVKAWRVTNPLAPAAVELNLPSGLRTAGVQWIASNGTRVLFVGRKSGNNLPVGWLDVTMDPTVETLSPEEAVVEFLGTETIDSIYPARDGNFILAHASTQSPAAYLTVPIADSDITFHNSGGIADATVVAATGNELVAYETIDVEGTLHPSFQLVGDAGRALASAREPTDVFLDVGEAPADLAGHSFGTAHDGSVLWMYNELNRENPEGEEAENLVFRWLDINGDGVGSTMKLNVATYTRHSPDDAYPGRVVQVGDNTAVVTLAQAGSPSQARVTYVERTGGMLVAGSASHNLSLPLSGATLVGGSSFAYVVAPNSGEGAEDAALYIYAPGCSQ